MHFETMKSRVYAAGAKLLAIFMVLACCMTMFAPAAMAIEIENCTARPTSDTTNDVMGATETRIDWQGKATVAENVKSITLTLPEGTTYEMKDSKLMVLIGEEFDERAEDVTSTLTNDGQSVTVTIDKPMTQDCIFAIQIYHVMFPAEGGQEVITGTYTTFDGIEKPIENIPAIEVTGMSAPEQLSNWLDQQGWVQAWNSNKFLHLFFDPTLLVTSFPSVVKGFFFALAIVVVSFPLAIPIGFVLSLMRMSKSRILRGLSSLYVNVVRGTPVFLQIYIAFFGLPLAGIEIPNFPLGVLVLAFNSAAYQCEIFRAGIQSIHKGQFEAARSLGMNGAQTMLFVIIPQTVRRVIPTLTNEFILLYKDTSMLAAVGVMEIVMYAKTIVAATGSITPYIVAACFYLLITLPLAKVVGILETKLDMDKKQGPAMQKVEDDEGSLSVDTEAAAMGAVAAGDPASQALGDGKEAN